MKEGKYVVIEGHDGTGKSTQVEKIRSKLLENGIDSIEFHEPAGCPVADAIRNVIKDGNLDRDAETNLLLFTASRHEIWKQRATQSLKIGKWVVASRSYFSSLAYQGYGEGLDLELIENTTMTFTDERYVNPDIAIIMSSNNNADRLARINNRGEIDKPDTFESRDDTFQQKVQNGYLEIAKKRNIPIINADQTIEDVTDDIWKLIEPML